MTVAHILQDKGGDVVSIDPNETVESAARLLSGKKIGAVLVMDGTAIVHAVAADGALALNKKVADLMTRDVVTCQSADAIPDLMAKMTKGRFRHVPVVEGDTLAGLISIGDVVKQRIAETEQEAEALREYITTG